MNERALSSHKRNSPPKNNDTGLDVKQTKKYFKQQQKRQTKKKTIAHRGSFTPQNPIIHTVKTKEKKLLPLKTSERAQVKGYISDHPFCGAVGKNSATKLKELVTRVPSHYAVRR